MAFLGARRVGRRCKDQGMKADAVWALLLGAAVALASTLLAQWASLAYQTRRQRESRQADFQRSALVQVRDLLLELSEAMGRVAAAHFEAMQRVDWDGALPDHHPAVAAVRSLADRVEIVAAAVEDDQLRVTVEELAGRAHLDATGAADDRAEQTRRISLEVHRKAVQLLGERLRELP
jgi:hypothetical protein